jgi:hypothetical protein
MIDIEKEVFGAIATVVRDKFPDTYVVGEYVKSPPKFPCVSVEEIDNFAYDNTQTSGSLENHASVTYEVNIYSNKTSGKKSECKAIASLIDNEFATLGLSRTMLQPIPNVDDATIYRITGRYKGVVSTDYKIFRR